MTKRMSRQYHSVARTKYVKEYDSNLTEPGNDASKLMKNHLYTLDAVEHSVLGSKFLCRVGTTVLHLPPYVTLKTPHPLRI